MYVWKNNNYFYALFDDGDLVKFGNNNTFIDHHDEELKFQWIRKNVDDYSNPKSSKTLTRFLLWNKPTLLGSVRDFKKIFPNI